MNGLYEQASTIFIGRLHHLISASAGIMRPPTL